MFTAPASCVQHGDGPHTSAQQAHIGARRGTRQPGSRAPRQHIQHTCDARHAKSARWLWKTTRVHWMMSTDELATDLLPGKLGSQAPRHQHNSPVPQVCPPAAGTTVAATVTVQAPPPPLSATATAKRQTLDAVHSHRPGTLPLHQRRLGWSIRTRVPCGPATCCR